MTSKRWNNDIAYAMNHVKLLAWPIGVWPLQVYNIFSLIRCTWATFSTVLTQTIIAVLPFIEIYLGCTDTEKNMDYLMLICCGILGIVKTLSFRIYAKNLIENYNSAVTDYQIITNPRDYSIMRKHTYTGRLLCCSLMGFTYFSCFIISMTPFLDSDNDIGNETILEYTLPSACTLEYFHTPQNMHTIICLFQMIVLFTSSHTNMGNDSLFLNITLHLCGQIKILNTKFVEFDATHDYDRLNTLIKRHIYLIHKAKELSKAANYVFLAQLSLISILLCVMGFQLILAIKMNDVVIIGKSLMVQCAFLFQLSLYSFIGDYLISQMEEIATSVYQSTWYTFSSHLKRNIIFVIMRIKYPVAFQAGNFITVNLSTYMNILKTSLSYLSVLRVMLDT